MGNVPRQEKGVPRNSEIDANDLKLAEQMEKDGKTIPPDLKAALDKSRGTNPTPPAVPPVEPPANPPKEEKPPAPAEEPKPPATPPKKDEEGEDDEDERAGEGGKQVEPPEPRAVRTVPVAKYQDLKRDFRKLQEENETLKKQSQPTTPAQGEDFDEKVKAFSEKSGMSIEEVKELVALAGASNQIPKEVLDAIQEAKTRGDEQKYWDRQFSIFNSEFDSDVAELRKTSKEEADLMAAQKDAIKDLAFTEGYEKKSPWEIFTRFIKPSLDASQGRKSAENRGGTSAGGAPATDDFKKIVNDPAAIRKLAEEDPKRFEDFQRWLEQNYGGEANVRSAQRM